MAGPDRSRPGRPAPCGPDRPVGSPRAHGGDATRLQGDRRPRAARPGGRNLLRRGRGMSKTKVAIIGSGNIGTDLMIKVIRNSDVLEMGAMVGIERDSDGLARARRMKVPTTHEGVDGLIALDGFDDIEIVFDATSAKAHVANAKKLAPYGKKLVDLTPAAIGPYVVPPVNLEVHLEADNVNMVTCGGQATIPMV